ncbi:PaaI family thioesterase [Chryseobacterium luquanense]|uniref:PaaI family thioesterase n=1 Tax=Chryseobacterium luquanense TaxID=2983766 RepID=A0ABT3Y7N3_9FLAO|nr:PaaI family thioesterase [Chryseobacterium luquanense]MCX8534128.1 PaaI family thioesterase [Chryseobacterium luquanense]
MYDRIKESFDRQGLMKTLNAKLMSVEKGEVKISSEFSEALTQQHGFFHAGVATNIADSACGYAALTLMPEDMEILSVEFKINFMKPAKTDNLIAVGKVLQPGRTLTICEGYVYDSSEEKLISKMTATMISVKK